MPYHDLLSEKGSGPAVVFSHGTLMDATQFDSQLDHLAERGYRALACNSRVLTGEPAPHTLDDLVEDCRALLDDLGIGKCVLAGLSVGGFMALEFALAHPERLNGLILMPPPRRAIRPRSGRDTIASSTSSTWTAWCRAPSRNGWRPSASARPRLHATARSWSTGSSAGPRRCRRARSSSRAGRGSTRTTSAPGSRPSRRRCWWSTARRTGRSTYGVTGIKGRSLFAY